MDLTNRNILVVLAVLVGGYYFWPSKAPEKPQVSTEEYVEEEELVEEVEPVQVVEEKVEKVVAQPMKPQTSQSPSAKYPNLDESFIPFDEEGNRYITQIVKIGKHLVYHGDVLIGDEKDLPRLMKNKNTGVKQSRSRKWAGGKIPYVIDDNVAQPDKVIDAIEYLNTFTNLKIVPRESEEDYVLLTLGESDCYSYAGRIGGKQEIFLVPQCGGREILHEWMHTIGFFHEQNREDRDQYLKIIWDNIEEINQPQFKKLPNDFIGLAGRPFDYQSIMLYSSETFSMHPGEPSMLTLDGEFMPRRKSLLSDEDIARVNLAYPATD